MDGMSIDRHELVYKSNDLIQKTRYELSANEQKLILWATSKIKPTDDDFNWYTFEAKEFCHLLGITENGKNYRNLREAVKKLADKSFWLDVGTNDSYLCRWFSGVRIKGTTISVRFDDQLRPFLLQLKNKFTMYELENVLLLQSKYAIRVYEVMKSCLYTGTYTAELEAFKQMLQVTEYPRFANFREKVIDVAVNEINEKTDLMVDYTTVKTGKAVTGISFTIRTKTEDELYMIERGC